MSTTPGDVWDAVCNALIDERDKYDRTPNDAASAVLTDAVFTAITAAGYDVVQVNP